MAELGWGNLNPKAVSVGVPFDKKSDFTEISYHEASEEAYKSYMHAAHAMIFTRQDDKLWDLYPINASIMMLLRFDGHLGFPGGIIDPGESPVISVNRECREEIQLDLNVVSFTEDDHMVSHVNTNKKLVTHFFAKEVSYQDYCLIEKNTLDAKEWGIETFGVIRAPLFALGDGVRGFPVFLANKFAGNAKEQMIVTLKKLNVIPEDELQIFLEAAEKYKEDSPKS